MIERIVKCDVCGKEEKEKQHGNGWAGWGQLTGVNNDDGIWFCPDDLQKVLNFINGGME